MWTSLIAHLLARRHLLLLLALLAASSRLGDRLPEERTLPALLGRVEEKSGVSASSAAWEPSRGALLDLIGGRPLLFLGREAAPAGRQDVFRAFVQVTPDGAPLRVRRAYNLTSTELADEHALLVRGHLAVFATLAFEQVQSVTVLDSRGVYTAGPAAGWWAALAHRLERSVTSWLETGTARGLGRTDIEFAHSPEALAIELTPEALSLSAGSQRWQLHAGDLGLRFGSQGELKSEAAADGLVVLPRRAQPKPTFHWLADVGRSLLGSGPIAWLEGRAFNVLDGVRRLGYGLVSRTEETRDPTSVSEPRPLPGSSHGPSRQGTASQPAQAEWPPPPIASLWKTPRPDEGVWKPVDLPFLRRLPGDASPYFYRTFVRPDRERPYADVLLVAMDMRRLELGMEGGYEDPRPSAGPPGAGHVPQDPEIYRRVVATFNGAFKTTHGSHGMVVGRRVLVPPKPGAATVRVDRSGRVGLGTWPSASASGPEGNGMAGFPEIVSLRQNMDPLLEGGVINPRQRLVWGSQLYGQGVAAERSALCVTGAGHLIYAWGEETSGETLAEALRMAGCDYGLHLDMNPGHCAFVFTDILDFERVEARTEVLDPRMRINPTRYIRWSPKDFFYVTLREPLPRGETSWQADAGIQPTPAWLPSILESRRKVGPLEVQLLRFDAERIRWGVQAGSAEPMTTTPAGAELDESSQGQVLASVGVGHSTRAARHGLAFGTGQAVPLNPSLATLVLPDAGPARVDPPGTPLEPRAEQTLVQLPLLAQDGELTARARQPGPLRRRGALCVDGEGHLLLALVNHDSSGPAAQALLQLGCGLVVETDRGSQHPPLLERAGTAALPRAGHEVTALYALGRPLRARGYWWRPTAPPAKD